MRRSYVAACALLATAGPGQIVGVDDDVIQSDRKAVNVRTATYC